MTVAERPAPDQRAAEATLRQAFEAYDLMNWGAVADLVHPDGLVRFQQAMIENQRRQEQFRSSAAAEPSSSDMPVEVRAWFQEQRSRRPVEHPQGVEADFAGVPSLRALEALSARDAYARWLEAHDPRAYLLRRHGAAGETGTAQVDLAEVRPRNNIVGSVADGDTTVHVIYRRSFPGVPWPSGDMEPGILAIATLRVSVDGWRIWTTRRDPELFGLENWVVAIQSEEERLQQLRDLSARVFQWPEDLAPRLRARVQGYSGGVRPPESVRLEEDRPDGSHGWVDVPYAAINHLWEYLEPMLYLLHDDEDAPPDAPHEDVPPDD